MYETVYSMSRRSDVTHKEVLLFIYSHQGETAVTS